jgi:hypothetical protein
MRCYRCHAEIDSILVNGIETEIVLYKCGQNWQHMHMGCVFNHHTEGAVRNCFICKGDNPDHNIEDVKAALENVINLWKIRLWRDLKY